MFGIKIVLSELSRLYEILKSNKKMTPEEYIKSKRREDYPGGHLCYTVSEEDALKAIEMARNEKTNSVWHDASEQPTRENENVIAIGEDDIVMPIRLCENIQESWNDRVKYLHIKKWAYVKDLLPKEGKK